MKYFENNLKHKNVSLYSFCLLIVIFIITKIPFLSIPFYWDEAWSYAVAIFDMHDHGISLIPGSVNTEFTRGHPLLYYVCASLWTKLFGTSLVSMHSFSLLISCFSLYALYILSKSVFNSKVAIIVTLLFSVQAWFWVQSTFLLPEIFLMLFTILSVYSYFSKKWISFSLWTSCVVLTKETGWLLIIIFFFDYFVMTLIIDRKKFLEKKYWINALALLFPLLILLAFLVIQKNRLGWFFFPGHIGLMHLKYEDFIYNFKLVNELFFFENYRKLLLLSPIFFVLFSIVKRQIVQPLYVRFVIFSISFIAIYVLFSSLNFFTVRYLLSILPFYILFSIGLLSLVKHKYNKIWNFYYICLFILFAHETITIKTESDVSIGYRQSIDVHRKAIQFCENKNWYNKKINTGFLEQFNITNPRLGYLKDTLVFNKLVNENPEIYVFYSCEYPPQPRIDSLKKDTSMVKIRRFENGIAWSEVYCKKQLLKK